jgi:hypothetical protein
MERWKEWCIVIKIFGKGGWRVLNVKILSIQYPERYVVRRLVTLAHEELSAEVPDAKMEITEIGDSGLICKYARVIFQPTLVINEKVVCSGHFPTKDEIIAWMREALQNNVDSKLAGNRLVKT